MKHTLPPSLFTVAFLAAAVSNLGAQDYQQGLTGAAEPDLATKLANPLAAMISVPI